MSHPSPCVERHFFPPDPAGEFDATTSLQAVLDAGPGVVRLAAGVYRLAGVTVPSGVTLIGAGAATVIRRGDANAVFFQQRRSHFSIRDLTLDGGGDPDWARRADAGENGLHVSGCHAFELSGLTLRNFAGAGLHLERTDLGRDTAPFSNGGSIDRVTAHGNFAGVRFDVRAEYINTTRLDCFQNVVGCVIHAGNVKVSASNLCSNLCGVLLEDKENGSHGCLTNCLINHNERTALLARGVRNGMMISNCAFFYGAIELIESRGVFISDSMINCHVRTVGTGVNRLAGNYVIPAQYRFDIAPATLLEGNYSDEGVWRGARDPRH